MSEIETDREETIETLRETIDRPPRANSDMAD